MTPGEMMADPFCFDYCYIGDKNGDVILQLPMTEIPHVIEDLGIIWKIWEKRRKFYGEKK